MPVWALSLLPKQSLFKLAIGGGMAFLLMVMCWFAAPIIVLKHIPLGENQSQFDDYIGAADQIESKYHVSINWQEVMAIDAVLLQQDFNQSSTALAYAMAKRFVKEEHIRMQRTCTDQDGNSYDCSYTQTVYTKLSLDDVLDGLVRSGELQPEQIEDVKRYTLVNATAMLAGGGRGGVPLPPEQITAAIGTALQVTGGNLSWEPVLQVLVMRESHGNPGAVGPYPVWYSAKWGYQVAKGLCQLMQPTFDAYKMDGYDDIWNPVDNLIASIRYIQSRYGSPYNIPALISGDYHGY
ncbi:transglycosylase SLT domain-containing protein [Paenibacillus humicola]|uniref:transglycosylase SLT domain-containing protein n=1 Tax=Paenibacillus humicola TaxID=3110540 RepID=UPI00237B1FFA|nr:transglycosylase SLT domain-containing protein [Paenibacillus humicola]